MKELLNKYHALEAPIGYIENIIRIMNLATPENRLDQRDKEWLYGNFKANISCIGLEPDEYEACVKWFCETMTYQEVTR